MRCILGIDTGGSKCEALAAGIDGSILGWGVHRISEKRGMAAHMGSGRSMAAIIGAIESAMTGVRCEELRVVCSLSGLPVWPSLWHSGTLVETYPVSGEYAGTLCFYGVRAGIVALVGTGALAHGVAPDGRMLTLDGMGPRCGDFGSGYRIGERAIRAALKAGWHARHQTSLADAVWQTLRDFSGDGDQFSPITYMNVARDRAEIASLAAMVDQHARNGDAQAIRILHESADEFSETVRDLAASMGMDGDAPFPLVAKGSVITRSEIYWQRFVQRVAEFAPNIDPVRMTAPPVAGYILEYAEGPGATLINQGFRERLLAELAASEPRHKISGNNGGSEMFFPYRPKPWKRQDA